MYSDCKVCVLIFYILWPFVAEQAGQTRTLCYPFSWVLRIFNWVTFLSFLPSSIGCFRKENSYQTNSMHGSMNFIAWCDNSFLYDLCVERQSLKGYAKVFWVKLTYNPLPLAFVLKDLLTFQDMVVLSVTCIY